MNILIKYEPDNPIWKEFTPSVPANLIFNEKPTDEEIACADIIMGNLPTARLEEKAVNLKMLQLDSAGVGENYRLCAPGKGIRVFSATGSYGRCIAEHMIGLMLGIQKNLFIYRDMQHEHHWEKLGFVDSFEGCSVLVIGMGNLGGEFAKLCHALGARVTGICRTVHECPGYCEKVGVEADIDAFLPQADIVYLAMPATDATKGIITRERIFSMKKGAILLNACRGSVIDQEALCDALDEGHLLGAGLDVTDIEPLPKDSRIWSCKNAVITPHISGTQRASHANVIRLAIKNINTYLEGGQPVNEVSFERQY